MRFTLKKKEILRGNKNIQKIFQQGRYLVHKSLILYYLKQEYSEEKTDSLKETKAAFIAGKKNGNAVVRNRLRRLMKESFRLHKQYLKKGFLFLLVGRKPAIHMKRQDMDQVFLELLKKADLLC